MESIKVRRFVSVLLVLLICFSSFGVNAAIASTQTAPPLTEQNVSLREESSVVHDPNWIPPEMQLTEEEYAALDSPNNVVELEYPPLLPNATLPEAGLMSTAAVTSGIKQFQQYINNNLPISYLGTKLDVDGGFGPLTKTAAIKLIQYRLNQAGANLTIDGGFGVLTQQAFLRYVGYIERYNTGNWVYILQGLLYCNNYDPNGFDGSYGVNGGTGCLNAVTSFRSNNSIVEGTTGSVGLQTMMKLLGRSFVQSVSNSAYYIRNNTSGKVLDVYNADTISGTKLIQYGLTGARNQKFYITYLGDGTYSMRPVHASIRYL